jgi:hypothetical protein
VSRLTAEELAQKIDWEGGTVEALIYGVRETDIEDEDLAHAWEFLRRQWDRFEVELRAWDAILNGRLRENRSSSV